MPSIGVRAFDMSPEQEAVWEPLFSAARQMLERGDGSAALESARSAWNALPEPKLHCSMAYITLMRFARACEVAKAHREGIDILDWAVATTPFQNNIPVFLVQKGILLLHSGEQATAREAFARSWALAKDFGFRGEDPKYLALLGYGFSKGERGDD